MERWASITLPDCSLTAALVSTRFCWGLTAALLAGTVLWRWLGVVWEATGKETGASFLAMALLLLGLLAEGPPGSFWRG